MKAKRVCCLYYRIKNH
ncbi:MAG TPA: hypothetical protein DDZ39_06665 [Flavobacteriaceae bacterium]|nr:hypothetical protein [Flavobacteriaceae bacterium]HBS12683.1 hypothetical protein [Flavobacteriaceae bacterium]